MENISNDNDLKKNLILALRDIKNDNKFIEDIYYLLQTTDEKEEMLRFLGLRKKLSTRDVELKALEITEPRYKSKRMIEDKNV